jgi:26S proteasome regulatory subunit N8
VDAVIDATESEEVGVEHLLRDINDPSTSTLAGTIKHKLSALVGLKESLEEMRDYLQKVVKGDMEPNNEIMYNVQSIFNLLPNLNVDTLSKAFVQHSNDVHLVMYVFIILRPFRFDVLLTYPFVSIFCCEAL